MNAAGQGSRAVSDRREWRPLKPRATRRSPEITNPVLEPYWSGTRVLAHFVARPDSGLPASLELLDEEGQSVNDRAPDVVDILRDSVMALEAVIDGVLTVQPTAGGEGTALIPQAYVPRMSALIPRAPQLTYERPVPPNAPPTPMAFVAVDLLSVDDHTLIDLPLLERKRQLESLFVESNLLRISPIARPPVGPWLNSWQAAGFRGLMMKAANSRYRPGDFTVEWTVIQQAQAQR
jgi:hypothetical protein